MPDGEPIVVPIARFSLREDVENPDQNLVWDLVGEAALAMQVPFDDVFVRHYDIQFTFDGDKLFEAEECRRVLLTDELVDDVLANDDAPTNHRASAEAIQDLVNEGFLVLRTPDFERYGGVIDEARRRTADDTLPKHTIKADQYIPALVRDLATSDTVYLVSADTKLRTIVQDIAARHEIAENVILRDPLTVL
ncbi:hypothetical protein [Haladaptatus salinisoli]|uniref:hypothetical protein n=1 Tax=Haladaptatus salinisoli TaxID=2884876 RepID=UPI003F625BB8